MVKVLDTPEGSVRHIFVYGTLRPDDHSGAPWTQNFCAGMTSTKARIEGLRLYFDSYPCVSVPDPEATAEDKVVGYLMSVEEGGASWDQKMKDADRIEGYPSYYSRSVVEALTAEGVRLPCFVYHRPDCCKSDVVPGGDWLCRAA
eukprot:Hpha_TRINITY_DN8580_c0_g1::TRINITY_DN8580_c0_g1_i1::g.146312::m.146312